MDRDPDPAAVTHDRLLGGRIQFDQPVAGYRAAIDPVLLAAAVPAQADDTVLELGSGAGAAALCLAARVPGCRIVGVERDAGLVAIANANADANGMTERVRFIVGDIAGALPEIAGGTFDHAMANPPYLEADRADLRVAGTPGQRTATIEFDVPLGVWLACLCGSVRRKGRVTLVHRADRLADLVVGLGPRAGDIGILPLWPKAGRPARRIIITARPGAATPLRLLGGLVLHDESGAFSDAAAAILNDAAPLAL